MLELVLNNFFEKVTKRYLVTRDDALKLFIRFPH